MKLLKTASGKQTIKISKKEWTDIGKKAGWMKTAAGWEPGFPDMTDEDWEKLNKSHEEKFDRFEVEKAKERRRVLDEQHQDDMDYKNKEYKRKKMREQERRKGL